MKKTLVLLAIPAIAAISSCSKDADVAEPAATYKVKTLGDLKEHTGWDRDDSTGSGEDNGGGPSLLRSTESSLMQTETSTTTDKSAKKVKEEKKPKKK